MKTRRPETLLELCVAQATEDPSSITSGLRGLRRGGRVAQFIAQWAIATADAGELATVADYSRWWRESEKEYRTTRNRALEFREVFPGYESPARLVEELGLAAPVAGRPLQLSDSLALMSRPLVAA
jgi:hypothetical protein